MRPRRLMLICYAANAWFSPRPDTSMRPDLDIHGQPLDTSFNAARRADRAIHEMLGLVKGVIVDGEVTVGEAQYLAHWINANPEAVLSWPGNALAQRLQRIFADGYVSDEEREDLRHFLEKMVGPDTGAAGDVNMLLASRSTTRLHPSRSRAGSTCSLAGSSGGRERLARRPLHVLGEYAGAE